MELNLNQKETVKKFCIRTIVFMAVVIMLAFGKQNIVTAARFTKASVVRVVDGDTIVAKVKGKEVKIRMIGVNTPESVHYDASKNTKQGKIASDFTKKKLSSGKRIYLEYDRDRTDPYGRTLAYVWTKKVKKVTFKNFCKYNFGAVLLRKTYCESVYYKPNKKYRKWYDKLERKYQK